MTAIELGLGAMVGLALTGAGGGIVAVPLLVFGLNLRVSDAALMALVTVCVSAAIGAWMGLRDGPARWACAMGLRDGLVARRTTAWIGGAGMAFSPVGVTLSNRVQNTPLMVLFAGILLWTGWRSWKSASRPAQETPAEVDLAAQHDASSVPATAKPPKDLASAACVEVSTGALIGVGAVAGLFSGLIGVGGGFIVVPWLTRHTRLEPRSIVVTSLSVVALVSLSGVAAAAARGNADWARVGPFALGSVGAVFLGRWLAGRLASHRLQQAFAALCGAVAVALLLRGLGWLALRPPG